MFWEDVHMESILVNLVCYNKKCYILGSWNNINLFLIVLEAGNSKSKVLSDLVPGESPFHGYVFIWQRKRGWWWWGGWWVLTLFPVSSYKSTNPVMGTAPSWPNYHPKSPSSNTITLRIWASTYEFGGYKHAVHSREELIPPASDPQGTEVSW